MNSPKKLPAQRPAPDEVHLWRVLLDESWTPQMMEVLSDDEKQRAARYRFPAKRKEFATSRAVLREVLAGYTAQRPRDLRFNPNREGKLSIASDLQFNLSHAGNVALIAVATCAVGVDVECLTSELDWQEVASHFFSSAEHEWLAAQPCELRSEAFLVLWTRREAYVKARGNGVPTEQACGLVRSFADEGIVWSIETLHPFPAYVGAVAAAVEDFSIVDYAWPSKSLGEAERQHSPDEFAEVNWGTQS